MAVSRPDRDAANGVLCPNLKCRSPRCGVVETRYAGGANRRVRRCGRCGREFSTRESVVGGSPPGLDVCLLTRKLASLPERQVSRIWALAMVEP